MHAICYYSELQRAAIEKLQKGHSTCIDKEQPDGTQSLDVKQFFQIGINIHMYACMRD